MVSDWVTMLVDVGQEWESFKLLLSHKAKTFTDLWHFLNYFFPMHVVVGPLAEAIGVPVLRTWAVDYLEVVLV